MSIFGTRIQAAIAGAVALLAALAAAQAPAQSLIRDAEIERTLANLASPILQAGGLSTATVDLYIVNDRQLQAFVAGGNNIFMHTGLLQRLDTPDQVRAVLAHEAGHINGGHLARRNDEIRAARGTTALGILLALGAAVAGNPDAAIAASGVSGQVALRNLLRHSRAEEAAADQAGLSYMVNAGADPRAMLEVMELFRNQLGGSGQFADPYVRTHPLWSERLRYIEDRVANSPRGRGPSREDVYWHARMVAKLDGFLGDPRRTLTKYRDDDTEVGELARAAAYHKMPDVDRATAAIDRLVAARPDDAFYHELRGQILLEIGRAGPATESYRRAVALAPNEPLILSGLGRALVAQDNANATREALDVLTRAQRIDRANPRALRDLALVHGRLGQEGQAALATAERMMLLGRVEDAGIHAARAADQLPTGSPGWRRADDIVVAARRAKKRGD
ncbi:MAG: M48 family metalloprotease [Pseudomonadota bacterium]